MNTRHRLACLAIALMPLLAAQPSSAQGDRGADRGPGARSRVEARHYPEAGRVVRSIPRERHAVVARGGDRYFYSRGVWYAPRGPSYVVVHAPLGVFVPVLPPFYTSMWFGGSRYFLADDTYYMWRDRERAYEVVDPPAESTPAASTASDDIFVYPKNGQSPEQLSKDRFECHRWAKDETQFDPTQPGGGVPEDQNASKRADYHRAITACLEGRGYSVK